MKRGQVPAASSLPPGARGGGRGEEEEEEEGDGRASRPVCEVHFQGFSLPPLFCSGQLDAGAPHALARALARSLVAFARITRAAFPRAAPPPCRGSAIEFNEGEKEGEIISAADGDVTAPAKGGGEINGMKHGRADPSARPLPPLRHLGTATPVEMRPAVCPLRAASLRSEPG